MEKNKSNLIIEKIVKVLIFLLVAFIIVCVAVPIMNNLYNFKFRAQFDTAAYPSSKTEEIQQVSLCGDTMDDGNFNYIAAMAIRVPDTDVKALQVFYVSREFYSAKDSAKDAKVEVIPLESAYCDSSFCTATQIYFSELLTEKDFTDCYAVIIYDDGYSSPFDYRSYVL